MTILVSPHVAATVQSHIAAQAGPLVLQTSSLDAPFNVGRGGVVDETALLDALHSGRLAGAYSDVFDTEPLPADSPLRDAPNHIISSHTAGRTSGSEARATQIFLDNLRRWGRAEPLVNLVVRPTQSTSGA